MYFANYRKSFKKKGLTIMFRRKAYWIYWRDEHGDKYCKCSKCKTSYGCFDTPYCPNCGREMKVKKEDEDD